MNHPSDKHVAGEWPEEICLVGEDGKPWLIWRLSPLAAGRYPHAEHRRYVPKSKLEEVEAERDALAGGMHAAGLNLINSADRRQVADDLLAPDAVRNWVKQDDEDSQEAARLEAERDQLQAILDAVLEALEAAASALFCGAARKPNVHALAALQAALTKAKELVEGK